MVAGGSEVEVEVERLLAEMQKEAIFVRYFRAPDQVVVLKAPFAQEADWAATYLSDYLSRDRPTSCGLEVILSRRQRIAERLLTLVDGARPTAVRDFYLYRRARVYDLVHCQLFVPEPENAGGVFLHASAFVVGGVGYAFAGRKGSGKSTLLLEALKTFRADLLANDRLHVTHENGAACALHWPTTNYFLPSTLGRFTRIRDDWTPSYPQIPFWREPPGEYSILSGEGQGHDAGDLELASASFGFANKDRR